MRQDPDVILVGELRDVETFEAAVHAAETGHLVFGTIHASSAPTTINRILDLFPPEKHGAIRQALANNLKAIVAQKLVKGLKKPRVPTNEIMIVNPIIKKLISEGRRRASLATPFACAIRKACRTSPKACVRCASAGDIDRATALEFAPNPEQLKMALKGIKVSAPGILVNMRRKKRDFWRAVGVSPPVSTSAQHRGAHAPCSPGILTGALAVLVMGADSLWAADTFPRGPGFYYSPFKIAFFLFVYLGWIKTCGWVSRDLQKTDNEQTWWNPLFLGVGLLSFFLLWIFPVFWLAWLFYLLTFAGVSWWYITVRNERVDPEDKMFTERHARADSPVLARDLRGGDKIEEEEADRPEVRFIGRSRSGKFNDGEDNVARVAESKGYRAAEDLVIQALAVRATDIHLEPTKDVMTVRFRVDGMMTNQQPFSLSMGTSVINIFKVIANLDISERRKAQDGGFSAEVDNRPVEFRVATAGSVVGEKMVMRVLDSSQKVLDLSQIGMATGCATRCERSSPSHTACSWSAGRLARAKVRRSMPASMRSIARRSTSSPSRTRSSIASTISPRSKSIRRWVKRSPRSCSILRQDPDVILVGEIRDKETAEIACQAAQTGHMVFSTLHANDCVTAVARLVDLGVEPFMLASSISGILGQRLYGSCAPRARCATSRTWISSRKLGCPWSGSSTFVARPRKKNARMKEPVRHAAAPATSDAQASSNCWRSTTAFAT